MVLPDSVNQECKIRLLSGDVKLLPRYAFVKYVSQQYWPSHIKENYIGVDDDLVVVYTQFGMGFIEKKYLNRGPW